MSKVTTTYNQVYPDMRGCFAATKLDGSWVQTNISVNPKKNTFRGLHFQIGEYAQAKQLKVITGEVVDFIVDIKPDSPTYLQSQTFRLRPGWELYVPKGYAHGFLTTEHDTVVQYLVDTPYSPDNEGSIYWKDIPGVAVCVNKLIGSEELVISDKDLRTKNIKL